MDIVDTDERDALSDLAAGAYKRLSAAAWAAKSACDAITNEAGDKAREAIDAGQRALSDARRHASALESYRRQLAHAVAKTGGLFDTAAQGTPR